jgi:hypothetical protein
LEIGEPLKQVCFGLRSDRLQQPQRHFVANDRSRLQQYLGRGGQAINPRGEHGLDGVWHPLRERYRLVLPDGVGQLLQKERIPGRFGHNRLRQSIR